MSDSGYNGLKAFGFTVGVTVLIFATLYVTKRYYPNLFIHESFSRNYYSWYFTGANDPVGVRDNRPGQSLGEKPRMWDIWIASRQPLRHRKVSRSEMLGPGEGESSDEGHDASYTTKYQKRLGWGAFFPLSADKVSDADTIVSSPQVTDGNPVQSTSPTKIRISAIVFMPTLPRTRFPTSTSTENTYDPPREYVLGTSYVPYAPDD